MEKQLKNLPTIMEQHHFKDAQFTQQERFAIYARLPNKKRKAWMPRIVFFLSAALLLFITIIFTQMEQPASYSVTTTDLQGMHFENQGQEGKYQQFAFEDNQLTIYPFKIEKTASEPIIYSNISVVTEGLTYSVYSKNELVMTLEKVAPRIVMAQDGSLYYSSYHYLSKRYEVQLINYASVDILNMELLIDDKLYQIADISDKPIEKNAMLSFSIPREHDTFHSFITLSVAVIYQDTEGNTQRAKLAQPIRLDNSYSDAYYLTITGDMYDSLELTEQTTGEVFLIEWLSDSMDRGNHDFDSQTHGKLKISPDLFNLQRGMVVYYDVEPKFLQENANLPNQMLGRIVGLPGETVEIKQGKVYINGQRLQTFYGEATRFGMNKDHYFEAVAPQQQMNQAEDYFNQSMPPITVEENTVFLLVDCWQRGYDSRFFGLIATDAIQGYFTGFDKMKLQSVEALPTDC